MRVARSVAASLNSLDDSFASLSTINPCTESHPKTREVCVCKQENEMYNIVFYWTYYPNGDPVKIVMNEWAGFDSYSEALRYVEEHDFAIPLEWEWEIVYIKRSVA